MTLVGIWACTDVEGRVFVPFGAACIGLGVPERDPFGEEPMWTGRVGLIPLREAQLRLKDAPRWLKEGDERAIHAVIMHLLTAYRNVMEVNECDYISPGTVLGFGEVEVDGAGIKVESTLWYRDRQKVRLNRLN